jgi:hypothetical protein
MGAQLTEFCYLALSFTVVNICAKLFNIHLPPYHIGLSNDYVSSICVTITYRFHYLRSRRTARLFFITLASSSRSCVWCPTIRQSLSDIYYFVWGRNWATHPNDVHRNVCDQSNNTLHNGSFGPTRSLCLVALYLFPLKLLAVRLNYWTVKGKLILREIFVSGCVCFLLF